MRPSISSRHDLPALIDCAEKALGFAVGGKVALAQDYRRLLALKEAPASEPLKEDYLTRCRTALQIYPKAEFARDMALLLVRDGGLWRSDYQSFTEFVQAEAHISHAQAHKRANLAFLHLQFADAGKTAVPIGRSAEALIQLRAPDHWVSAWEQVQRRCAGQPGKERVESELRFYAREHGLPFKDEGLLSTDSVLEPLPNQESRIEENPVSLNTEAETALLRFLASDVLQKVTRRFPDRPVVQSLQACFRPPYVAATISGSRTFELYLDLRESLAALDKSVSDAVDSAVAAAASEAIGKALERYIDTLDRKKQRAPKRRKSTADSPIVSKEIEP